MKYYDLFSDFLLAEMYKDGYVRRQMHPTEPLMILNYTEKAQYEGKWNEVTRQCRGLIVNTASLEIVAKPFGKFHNYSEYGEGTKLGAFPFGLDEPVVVNDKLDGSLGIAYQCPSDGLWAIATRGSFTSEQAEHATELLNREISAGGFNPCGCHTYLFEIIYPENRIVVDYGDTDELVLLGAVQKDCSGCDLCDGDEYGGFMMPHQCWSEGMWKGLEADVYTYETFRDALAAEPRPGKEGLVVWFFNQGDFRVKLKQDDYIALHRLVTGLNERTVWEAAQKGRLHVDALKEALPEEFQAWVDETYTKLLVQHALHRTAAIDAYSHVMSELNWPKHVGSTRKLFAAKAQELYPDLLGYLFLQYDRNDAKVREKIWKDIKPRGDTK